MYAGGVSVGPFGQDPGDLLAGATQCPHCNGVATVRTEPALRQVCNVCGAPRIEIQGQPKLSGRERPHLEAARTAERQRLQWKVGSWFGGITSGFIFVLWMLFALIFGAGLTWAISGMALAAPFVVLALAGFARSKGKAGDVQTALQQAWKSAARDLILAHPNGITTKRLAEMLPMSEDAVEQLAAELSVDNEVSSRVTDDGRLLLQGSGAPTGMRIDAGASPGVDAAFGDPLEERFAELEQAEQEAKAGRTQK